FWRLNQRIGGTMYARIRTLLISAACGLVALTLGPILGVDAADAPSAPVYVVKGDLAEVKSKGAIRFLVHGDADYLPRAGDPRAAEHALAEDLARKLGLNAVFVPVAEQDDLITELSEGRGDVIVGSLAITAERSKRIAFSRPIRFIDQLVVVRASDTAVQQLSDLAGQEVVVREGSSYAEALRAAKVKDIKNQGRARNLTNLGPIAEGQLGRGKNHGGGFRSVRRGD